MILGFDAIGRVALGGTASNAASYSFECDVGDFAFTGLDAHDPLFPATAGSFTVAGQTALATITMPASAGDFTYAGIDANLIYGQVMIADAGTFTLTGGDAMEGVMFLNYAETGEFEMKGGDISRGLIISFANRITRGGSYRDQITSGPSIVL